MADVKISALPSATTPLAGSEQIPLVQGVTTKQTTVDDLFTASSNTLANLYDTTITDPAQNDVIQFDSGTGKWINQQALTETVYTVTDDVIDVTNGTIQMKTMDCCATLTVTMDEGQSLTLNLIGANTNAPTFTSVTWITATGNVEPIWTANDFLVLFKMGGYLYANYVGSAA